MLVITRRAGESFVMTDKDTGREVTVHVMEQKGHQVRIGIDAPREINIARSELLNKNEK